VRRGIGRWALQEVFRDMVGLWWLAIPSCTAWPELVTARPRMNVDGRGHGKGLTMPSCGGRGSRRAALHFRAIVGARVPPRPRRVSRQLAVSPFKLAARIDASSLGLWTHCMTKVEEIRRAIGQLTPRERAELNALLQNWVEDDWDKQMAADTAPGGKLDKLRRQAEVEARAGRLHERPAPGE